MPISSPIRRWTKAPDQGALFIYTGTLGLFAGVLLQLLLGGGVAPALLASLLGVALVFVLRTRRIALAVLVFCALFALGGLRTEYEERELAVSETAFGYASLLEGSIVRDPESRESSTRVVVELSSPESIGGKQVLVLLDRGVDLSYGDIISLRGEVEKPEAFETDSGRLFDYPSYLKAKGISAVMYRPTVLSQEEGDASIRGLLYSGKHAFERSVERVLLEPSAGFLKGILLGIDALPEDTKEDFIAVGIIHIVVLSGYNITLVAEAFMRFLKWVRAKPAVGYTSAALAVVLFVVMTGAEETAVRAGIMAQLLILARALKRPGDMLRALSMAGFAMVAWNPHVLLGSPSFALSFLATLGLILLAPPIEVRLSFVTDRFALRGILSATLAAQTAVFPYILWMSGIVSPYSVLVNFLVLPLMPLAMFVGFGAAVLGFVHTYLAFLPGLLVGSILSLVVWFADVVAGLPGASFTIRAFPWWGSVLLYGALVVFLVSLKHHFREGQERYDIS